MLFKKLLFAAVLSGTLAQGQVLTFDGNHFELGPNQNSSTFEIINEDMDGLIPFSNDPHTVLAPSFLFPAYSTDQANFPQHEDGDTAYWIRSASQFTTSGTADNWFTFGPIKIPSNGAAMTWKDRFPAGLIESYEVYISTEGGHAYSDIDPDVNPPVWERPLQDPGNAHTGNPENWTNQSTDLSEFAGQEVYIAFRHHYWNGYLLDLDEIAISEGLSLENLENEPELSFYPNPTQEGFFLDFQSNSAQPYTLALYNLNGQQVMNKVNGYTPSDQSSVYVGLPPLMNGHYLLIVEYMDAVIPKHVMISQQ